MHIIGCVLGRFFWTPVQRPEITIDIESSRVIASFRWMKFGENCAARGWRKLRPHNASASKTSFSPSHAQPNKTVSEEWSDYCQDIPWQSQQCCGVWNITIDLPKSEMKPIYLFWGMVDWEDWNLRPGELGLTEQASTSLSSRRSTGHLQLFLPTSNLHNDW
jgi:hypothetical protein